MSMTRAQVAEIADPGGRVAVRGQHELPVAHPSPGPLGSRREARRRAMTAAGSPARRSISRPIASLMCTPHAHVVAQPGGQSHEVRPQLDAPAGVLVVVDGVVAQDGGGERLGVAGSVQQAGRASAVSGRSTGGDRRPSRRRRSGAGRRGREPTQPARAERGDPRVEPVARRVEDGRDAGARYPRGEARRRRRSARGRPCGRRRTGGRCSQRAGRAGARRGVPALPAGAR